ncbi:MAG: succinyldiaminopimelate transaminase [Methylomonas sp.]|nr:succinyldiaminopimelate transaminase [Methylomonas sp.]PPD21801.1 MAG: succinyldiaminopimelate transaminase [Methylomonas sp.]PPD27486.1 MAG: succinyldiaminopimelate transaminase [Methylomonas sp.]PPD39469.1 MAG: succinyldiaminopimelate transaminase [Methylomonas sp.]PPD42269.1 MAG: succinyldiaminopimelate transaminase [Methylomonas sp.]
MNPQLQLLHPYPFEKLASLKSGVTPAGDNPHIALSIGEPKHPTPHFIQEALLRHLHGLTLYPTTKGLAELRQTMADWACRRFAIPAGGIDGETQVLPVNGTREALFSFVQAVINPAERPVVIMPNPFYQIYEGAALLAGAEPYYLNTSAANGYLPDFDSVSETLWRRCQLLFICSPGNPTGAVISQAEHEKLMALAEKYDFVIASDECYTELYDDEAQPPQGLLQSAYAAGNTAFERCVIFQSLSKRSNAPGLRSGFVAGDASVLKGYFNYRTYHGCPMPVPTQHASIAAWSDEEHVRRNRQLYRDKFTAVIDILQSVCPIERPAASFYLWLKTPIADTDFARQLYAQQNVTVLPGSYLSRDSAGINPGANHVRIALVAPIEECVEAARRIKTFLQQSTA